MSTDIQARDWLHLILQQSMQALPAKNPPWLQQVRQYARQALEVVDLPNRKQEAWRYSNVEKLLKLSPTVSHDNRVVEDLGPYDEWLYSQDQSYRLGFVNGRCSPALSNIEELSCDITMGSLRSMITMEPELVAKYLGQIEDKQHDAFAELNRALINDGLFVYIPANVQIDKPIEIVHINRQSDTSIATHARNIVVLETGASATIIERYISADSSINFYNGISEILLADNAQMRHYCINEQNRNSYHLEQRYVSQLENSRYNCAQFSSGATWAKTDINVALNGSGADCELNGLYIVGESQLNDIHVNVIHKATHCDSRENFKGILTGKGRAVFDGRILVEKDAQKSNAHLGNKNLILTRDAEVDTKPQLEILADDVKCSHGTTIGQLDPNQIFYMRARGLSEDKAKELLCLGFAGEIIDKIADEKVQTYIAGTMQKSVLAGVTSGGA